MTMGGSRLRRMYALGPDFGPPAGDTSCLDHELAGFIVYAEQTHPSISSHQHLRPELRHRRHLLVRESMSLRFEVEEDMSNCSRRKFLRKLVGAGAEVAPILWGWRDEDVG